jgi:hypothetical protein
MECQTGDALGLSCYAQCTGEADASYSDTTNQAAACAGGDKCATACHTDDWSCLGKVEWPQFPAPAPLLLYGTVVDYPSGNTLTGFDVKMCIFGHDSSCDAPVDEKVSNANGDFVLDLEKTIASNGHALSAYFEVTPPAGLDYPTHLFFEPGWALSHSWRQAFVIYSRTSKGSVAGDPKFGDMLFVAHDCKPFGWTLYGAGGVQVTADPAGTAGPTRYPMQNLQLDPSATATYPYGVGFIQGLPPGQVILTARRQETQELIGKMTIWVRAGATSIVDMGPTP